MANRLQTSLLGTLDQMQERISEQDDLMSTDPTSAILRWEQPWEGIFLPDFQISTNLFEDVDPIIDVEGFGQSWSNMQEWADISFQPPSLEGAAPQDIENETMAADGVRFCCYGMIPDVSVNLVGDTHHLSTRIDPSQTYQSFEEQHWGEPVSLPTPQAPHPPSVENLRPPSHTSRKRKQPNASSAVSASALVTTMPLATLNAAAISLRPDDKEVLRFEEHHSVFGDDGVMRGVKVRFNKAKKTTSYFLDKGRNDRRADIIGDNGHSVGDCWPYQICLLRDSIHGSLQGGIYGNKASGAYSIVVLGDSAYATMDQDVGDKLYYSGSGSLENADPDNLKVTEGTAALQTSALNKNPVRVIRGKNKMKKDAPKEGFRYDGLYKVVAQEQLVNGKGGAYLRFNLERLPVQPPVNKSRPNADDLKKFRAIKQAVQEKCK